MNLGYYDYYCKTFVRFSTLANIKKTSMIVFYESRVVITIKYNSRVVIYAHRGFIRFAVGHTFSVSVQQSLVFFSTKIVKRHSDVKFNVTVDIGVDVNVVCVGFISGGRDPCKSHLQDGQSLFTEDVMT